MLKLSRLWTCFCFEKSPARSWLLQPATEPKPITKLGPTWGLSRELQGPASLLSERKESEEKPATEPRPRDSPRQEPKASGAIRYPEDRAHGWREALGQQGIYLSSRFPLAAQLLAHLSPPLLPTDGKISSCPGNTLEATSSSSDGHKGCRRPRHKLSHGSCGSGGATRPGNLAGADNRVFPFAEHPPEEFCLGLGGRAKPLVQEQSLQLTLAGVLVTVATTHNPDLRTPRHTSTVCPACVVHLPIAQATNRRAEL